MKFGQNLHRYHVMEWTPFYIDYRTLKKLLRLAKTTSIEQRKKADFTDFTALLEHDLTKAQRFYMQRHTIIQQGISALCDHYAITGPTDLTYTSWIDLEDLIVGFVELRDALKQLHWFGLVNFNKIADRLREFGGGYDWPLGADHLGVHDIHVTSQSERFKDLDSVNDWLAQLQSKRLELGLGSKEMLLLQRKDYDGLLPRAVLATHLDDVPSLDQILDQSLRSQKSDRHTQRRLLFTLLHSSILCGSRKCVERLLSYIDSLQEFGNHLHWLVIKLGRRKKLQNRKFPVEITAGTAVLSKDPGKAIQQLTYVIHQLGSALRPIFHERDFFGRLPLHHAVQYGLFEVCQAILKHMKGARCAHSDSGPYHSLLPDSEGLTALNLAVLTGNAAITEVLLEDVAQAVDGGTNTSASDIVLLPGNLLTTALKLGSFVTVQLLLASPIDVDYKDYNNENAMYLAVLSGRLEYVTILLETPEVQDKMDLDAPEAVYGWTPLILACVIGHLAVIDLLLQAGADPRIQDMFGWTAKDHAAFRGYLPTTKSLMALDLGSADRSLSIEGLRNRGQRIRKVSLPRNSPETWDQNIPPNCSLIYVNLGPLDTYKPVTAVNMGPYVVPDVYNLQREADFQIEVRAVDGDQSSYVTQVPILEDMANKPWRFITQNPRDFKLAFNVFHAQADGHGGKPLIGSAVALLEKLKQGLGPRRESLIRDFTIPILQKDTLRFIGTVTFYFVIVTPLSPPLTMSGVDQKFGECGTPTLIGHRGTGQNDPSRRQLQIGENTKESFLSAIDLGASYIEVRELSI